jgi:serine/threonine-protein kinase
VYDASSDEATPYLVMERLEGETLRARIERAPLSWDELLILLVPALRGVVELHRQGIIHRDLKPDNVFLAVEPGSAQPCAKVLDFGVSLLRSVDALEESLTGTGAIVGTPSYMPLEQLRGDDSVDARTDVYALGVVLFEALSGRRPWQARSAAEYGALLASARPTRLSTLRPELKGAREAAIMKALERRPEDRHPSVEAFIAALLETSRPGTRIGTWLGLGAAVVAVAVALGLWRSQAARPEVSSPGRTARSASVVVRSAGSLPQPVAPIREEVTPVAPAPAASTAGSAGKTVRARVLAPARRIDVLPSPAPRTEIEVVEPKPPPSVSQPTDRAVSLTRDEF